MPLSCYAEADPPPKKFIELFTFELEDGGGPSLNGSLSISYSLFAPAIVFYLLFPLPAPPPPMLPNMSTGSYVAFAGWNELKKSSPPKSMSNFFALSA